MIGHRVTPLLLFLFLMNKKVYLAPQAKPIRIVETSILTNSGTGATGEDVPWAAKRGKHVIVDDLYIDDELDFDEE